MEIQHNDFSDHGQHRDDNHGAQSHNAFVARQDHKKRVFELQRNEDDQIIPKIR